MNSSKQCRHNIVTISSQYRLSSSHYRHNVAFSSTHILFIVSLTSPIPCPNHSNQSVTLSTQANGNNNPLMRSTVSLKTSLKLKCETRQLMVMAVTNTPIMKSSVVPTSQHSKESRVEFVEGIPTLLHFAGSWNKKRPG